MEPMPGVERVPAIPEIRFGEAPRGRVTGWAVACTVHGPMPVLAPDRTKAIIAAGRHRDAEHSGSARILEVKTREGAPMMLVVLLLPTVVVVVVCMVAGDHDTRIGPLSAAPGPGRRDRRPLAPVVQLERPAPVELVETRVEIRRVAHA